MSTMHKHDAAPLSVQQIIDAIVGCEASDDELREMIAIALAGAARNGAEAMRDRCEERVRPVEWLSRDECRISDGHELADTIRALPLPTAPGP